MAKRLVPSIKYRWCTYKFKIRPALEYVKRKYGRATILIGYTYDERHRIKHMDVDGIGFKYPLVDLKITRNKAIKIIKDAGLHVPRKSACWFCPFASEREILRLKFEYTDLYEKLKRLYANCMREDLRISFHKFDKQTNLLLYC